MSARRNSGGSLPRTGIPGAPAAILVISAALGGFLFSFNSTLGTLALAVAGTGGLAALLVWPELALALYVVIGDVKGDERIASLVPYDLTLVLGAVLIAGIALNLLRGKQPLPMPPAYFLFVVLIAMMTASLSYTPVFAAGLEKLGRFLCVTSIAIFAPFFALGTLGATKRFLAGLAAIAFTICAWSLHALGGAGRLATPSDNTIGLGHIACALILLIWFAVDSRLSLPWRFVSYAFLAVPALALIGSGSRGPAVACAAVIFISLLFCRRRWLDVALLAVIGAAAFPFAKVPASSRDYLGTLIVSKSLSALMSFRGDLLASGWTILRLHPLLGIGIQGFRYGSPNPALYNWPHNIFLEVACELGIPAGLIVCAIFGSAIRESFRQLRNRVAPDAMLAEVAAALLLVGIINGTNTGDINSDRSTWLFLSLVFVVRGLRLRSERSHQDTQEAPRSLAA